MLGDLRSDHAGESGAVWIYRGILCVSPDVQVRSFARRHLATEKKHLEAMRALLPPLKRSFLLPAWLVAGFLTGALPALFGAKAVFATVAAVEKFVEQHYQEQINKLVGLEDFQELRTILLDCQADESEHRLEALAGLASPAGKCLELWCALVGSGSRIAVKLAHKI
jgi:demethoxyubiquinone hydroxylase (CLK1/Coq7/Cat5 family)